MSVNVDCFIILMMLMSYTKPEFKSLQFSFTATVNKLHYHDIMPKIIIGQEVFMFLLDFQFSLIS